MSEFNTELEFQKLSGRVEHIEKIVTELKRSDERQRENYISKEALDAFGKWIVAELEKRDERLKPITTIVYGVMLSVLTSAATLVFMVLQ